MDVGNLEANCFIRLCSHEQVLVLRVWLLYTLLVGRHQAILGFLLEEDLWVLDLEQQRFLIRFWVLLLDNLVPRLSNFLDLAPLGFDLLLWHIHTLSLLPELPPMQIRLVFLPRSMRQIRVLRRMQG